MINVNAKTLLNAVSQIWPTKVNAPQIEHTRIGLLAVQDKPLLVAGTDGRVMMLVAVSAKVDVPTQIYFAPPDFKKFLKAVGDNVITMHVKGDELTAKHAKNIFTTSVAKKGFKIAIPTGTHIGDYTLAGAPLSVYEKVIFGHPQYTVLTTDTKQFSTVSSTLPVKLTVPSQYFKKLESGALYQQDEKSWYLQAGSTYLRFAQLVDKKAPTVDGVLAAEVIAEVKGIDLGPLTNLQTNDRVILKIHPPEVSFLGANRHNRTNYPATCKTATGQATIKLPPIKVKFKGAKNDLKILDLGRTTVLQIDTGGVTTLVGGLIR